MFTRNFLKKATELPLLPTLRRFAVSTVKLEGQLNRNTCGLFTPNAGIPGPAATWGAMHVRKSQVSVDEVFTKSHMSSILERGAYVEKAFQHVTGSEIKSLDVVSDGKLLSVKWEDGKSSQYHSVWLRSMCFCPDCRMDHTGQSTVKFENVTSKSRIVSARDDGEGCLDIQWEEDNSHCGYIPLKFLKAHCYSKESLEEIRNKVKVTFPKDRVIPRFQYDDVMNSRQGLHRWVNTLNERGLSIVEGIPSEPGMGKKVCQRIAPLIQHTHYGEVFDVKVDPRPINAAFNAGALKFHMDEAAYEAQPGIQALFCVKFDENIEGGDSLLIDMFEVAETFRTEFPEEFDLLCKVPIAFQTLHYDRDWPAHMVHRKTTFTLNKYGDIVGLVFHPHSMSPLKVEEELVEPFFDAYSKLTYMINNSPNIFKTRLRAGEMLAFNNRRMAHGRAAFTSQAGERFLQGCYIEASEFQSCVHWLSNVEGNGRHPKRMGNYDML